MDGVGVAVAVLGIVDVGMGEEVTINVDVALGICVKVGGIDVKEAVDEGKIRVIVTPGIGVRVGIFGTHNLWPV